MLKKVLIQSLPLLSFSSFFNQKAVVYHSGAARLQSVKSTAPWLVPGNVEDTTFALQFCLEAPEATKNVGNMLLPSKRETAFR